MLCADTSALTDFPLDMPGDQVLPKGEKVNVDGFSG
jgi:hypothetical protein